jgi:cellulose biosynthesis protein BcsQ
MIVVVASHKGGTGKTSIATLIMCYWLGRTESCRKIMALDLDAQLNFSDRVVTVNKMLPDVSQRFFNGKTKLKEIQAVKTYRDLDKRNFCVVDTPPGINATVAPIIIDADLAVIPTSADKHSVQGAMRVAALRKNSPVCFVFSPWKESAQFRSAYTYLLEQYSKSCVKMPVATMLLDNFDFGTPWYVRAQNKKIDDINRAVIQILKRADEK